MREGEEKIGTPADKVNDEEIVPPLFAVVESHHVDGTIGDVYRDGSGQYGHHTLNSDHILSFGNFDVHFIILHNAQQNTINPHFMRNGHRKLRALLYDAKMGQNGIMRLHNVHFKGLPHSIEGCPDVVAELPSGIHGAIATLVGVVSKRLDSSCTVAGIELAQCFSLYLLATGDELFL